MKSLAALVLIIALALGGAIYYNFQQSSKHAKWTSSMHSYMQQLAEYQSKSQNEARLEAAASRNQTNTKIAELRAAIEGLTFNTAEPAGKAEMRAKAQKELDEAKKNAGKIDTSKLAPEVKDHYEEFKDKNPKEIAQNIEAARERAQELSDHYNKIVLDLRDRNQKRDALMQKLEQLQAINPRTADVEKQIEQTKDEIEKLDREIEELEKECEQTKLVLDLFKALLHMAAILSFASGNPAAGFALMQAAGMLEGVGEDDGKTGGTGGGYPPLPPAPVPPIGGVKPVPPTPTPVPNPIPGPNPDGVQVFFEGDNVYAQPVGGARRLLFKAEGDLIELIKNAEHEKTEVDVSNKKIVLEMDGSGYIIGADASGRATIISQFSIGD